MLLLKGRVACGYRIFYAFAVDAVLYSGTQLCMLAALTASYVHSARHSIAFTALDFASREALCPVAAVWQAALMPKETGTLRFIPFFGLAAYLLGVNRKTP